MKGAEKFKKQERFSVMIPTFEPSRSLLDAIQSVLKQFDEASAHGNDLSKNSLQITVVDDASSTVDVSSLLQASEVADHVEFIGSHQRLGLAGNWNRAISLARGDLVHLLHQDDFVQPGFYHRMGHAFQKQPNLGMAFCRTKIVDDEGHTIKKTSRLQWRRGVLNKWLNQIGERQRIQCPAAVVQKSTYQAIDGFRSDLVQALDWEMWVRIAGKFSVWYEPQTLAVYRRHKLNESSRLSADGAVWPNIIGAIKINADSFPAEIRTDMVTRSAYWYAKSCLRTTKKQMRTKDYQLASKTLEQFPTFLNLISCSKLKEKLHRRANLLRKRML